MDSTPTTPKRKRVNHSTLHPPPGPTSISPSVSPTSSEPNSPRTAVAKRLFDLRLDATTTSELRSSFAVEGSTLSKRLRFSAQSNGFSESSEVGTPEEDIHIYNTPHPAETPASTLAQRPPPSNTTFTTKPLLHLTTTSSPTKPSSHTTNPITNTFNPVPSPNPTYADLPSDDDGRGINGIGYRPTPAMAHARAQKRKQQVLDWRAREAKEARQKRSERRVEGEESGAVPGGRKRGRVVRFA